MKQNTTIHIVLSVLLVATHATLTMEKESLTLSLEGTPENSPRKNQASDDNEWRTLMMSQQSGRAPKRSTTQTPTINTKNFYNGFYAKHIKRGLLTHIYRSDHGNTKNNSSKITYEDKITKETKTVRFSGKNSANEAISYDGERYHVIVDENGDDMFAIDMLNSSQSSRSQSPDPSLEATISTETNQEKDEVPFKPILDNMRYTDTSNTTPNRKTTIGFFSNTEYTWPQYDCVKIENIGNNLSEITYKKSDGSLKTITVRLTPYNQEKYIVVTESIMGLSISYVINIEQKPTAPNANQEQSDSSTTCAEKPQITSTSLYSLYERFIPNDIEPIYNDGKITKSDCYCYEITYTDGNGVPQTISVNNTNQNPTFVVCNDSQTKTRFGIKLQQEEKCTTSKSTKSTHKQAFNSKSSNSNPHTSSYRTARIMGITSFAVLCATLLAYHYNKLPDTFAQLLDNLLAQCKNCIPSSFSR